MVFRISGLLIFMIMFGGGLPRASHSPLRLTAQAHAASRVTPGFHLPASAARQSQDYLVLTSVVTTITIKGSLSGASPNTTFKLDFDFSQSCRGQLGEPKFRVGSSQATTDAQGNAQYNFTINFNGGVVSGFFQITATSLDGRTTITTPCVTLTTALIINGALTSTPNTTFKVDILFHAADVLILPSSSGLEGMAVDCPGQNPGETAQVLTSLPVTTGANGTTTINATVPGPPATGFINGQATAQTGGQTISSSCVAVTSPALAPMAAPMIISVARDGKNLLITGANFSESAVILLDGVKQKTVRDDATYQTTLKGKKLFKKIEPGQTVRLRVRNSDNESSLSNEFIYTRP